jgi:membrane-associated phospholipid phosphatase
LFLSINNFAKSTPWLQPVVLAYPSDGIVVFAALMIAGWSVARGRAEARTMAAALWVPLATLIAVGINQPIADLVGQERPYAVLPDILVLAQHTTDPAFPSDHAVMAGAVTAGLFLVSRRLGLVAAAAAALMAFARVYIAAHYPIDVLAGLLLGATVSLLGFLAVGRMLQRLVTMAEGTALRPLLTTGPTPA